ncbi:acylphosphatase [soil metagenome]
MTCPETPQRLTATVHGSVQGVGFRVFVSLLADSLGLSGWVANEPDGSVAVVAEGCPAELARLEAALRAGPPGASVKDVRVQLERAAGSHTGFRIRSRAHPGD